MNAVSTVPMSAIEWPAPIINDPASALGEAIGKIERLCSLVTSNNDDMLSQVVPGSPAGRKAEQVWEIYTIVGEKLDELRQLVSAIEGATEPQPTSSVAKHVDIRQRHDWAEAVAALKSAREASMDAMAEGRPFEDLITTEQSAFKRLLDTRAPNLRCLHEKAMIITNSGDWSMLGVDDSIMADVEALARKYEIAAKASDGGEG